MKTKKTLHSIVLRVFRVAVLTYLGFLGLVAGCQRRLIYFPSRQSKEEALNMARWKGMEPWHDADGELAGWRRPAPAGGHAGDARRRVLVFHGNAGYALHRTYYVEGFENLSVRDWDVIILEYPGYGARAGKPSERTITEAAFSAFSALMREDPAPVYLVGESLGSGPVCRLAGEHPDDIAGLWLVTPFSSLTDAARVHYPFLPARLLLRDRYDNVSALQEYHGRLAVLTAGLDRVVPPELGRWLYEEAVTPYKTWIQNPQADHNTLDLSVDAPVWSNVAGFWTKPLEELGDEPFAVDGEREERQGGDVDD